MNEKTTIIIHSISSISESYFSLRNKSGMLKVEPFIIKIKKNPKQDCPYHFDAEDLVKMNKIEPSIFPFHHQTMYRKNDYIDYVKQQFEIIIKENRLLPLLEHLYGTSLEDYEFCWGEK